MSLEVIPAIDLRAGRCVRLYQGNFSKETVYSDDPALVARRWAEAGAPRLHVVDLDGAAAGQPVNTKTIAQIAAAVPIPVQVGGGLRTMEQIEAMLALGIDRVVLGTAVVQDQRLVEQACSKLGNAIVAGIDARGGLVATHGWTKVQHVPALDLIQQLARLGIGRVIYTDIARDGALRGPNLHELKEVAARTSARLIASGGVTTLQHIQEIASIGVEGVIIGKALYTGAIDLAAALDSVRR